MKITKNQLRRIIQEQRVSQDAWVEAFLDFIYSNLGDKELWEETSSILGAMQEVAEVLESEEANPSTGNMYGEERY